jgi:hypothetical protein
VFVKLNIKTIKNFSSINNFDYSSEWSIRQEDEITLYFQLVDADQDNLRYLPTDSSYSVSVIFPTPSSASPITKVATQVSSLDRSIWSVQINSTDKINSGNFNVTFVEGSNTKKFSVLQGIVVEALNEGGC